MRRRSIIVLLLSGILLSMSARAQVQPGAAGVYDALAPGGYAYPEPNGYPGAVVSDLTIRNNLNRALFGDGLLNSIGMRAQISNGVVTLQGRADNSEDVARAIWHAYHAGAQLVISRLRIGP